MSIEAVEFDEDMDLGGYTKDVLNTPKYFHPKSPCGKQFNSVKIYVKSVKSDEGLDISNTILNRRAQQERGDIRQGIQNDIDLAMVIITGVEGVVINKEKIPNNKEGIARVVNDFEWIRTQAIKNAESDAFFFKKN